MKRRTFIKNTIPLAFSPLFVESIIRQKVSKMFGVGYSPEDFKERKLIIVNLFGGNDGLNTAVPLDQYDIYAGHRPTIKIEEPSLIKLDMSLADDRKLGLHPSLLEFKSLYDDGKLNVIQSVGYPTPNFSHFRSDSLIFGAKDGTFTSNVEQGWIANYLATTHPSFDDRPTSQYPYPLGIQIGLGYRHNGFVHGTFNNIGVNINNLAENNFYSNLRAPGSSEYKMLLEYLKQVELGSQQYRENLEDYFNAGSNMNGSTLYPSSSLGKQLKSIARLINGGLDTKILVAYQSGLDTHHSQVDISNTNLGNHAKILESVSKSIFAFQKDMEGQGIDDKVIILVISEFGRQILQNANVGTDHGSLAPWFVIGTPVKGGVTGRNIDLSLVDGNHTADVLQHDYRRILSTIIQDWFGNTDTVLDQVGLSAFSGEEGTPDGKLDILNDDEVVTDTVNNFSEVFIDVFDLVEVKTENGWTYYGRTASSEKYVFAIEHLPDGGNTEVFTAQIRITDLLDDGTGKNFYERTNNNKGNFIFGKSWNLTINSGSVNGFVNMRFFISFSRLIKLEQHATNFYEGIDNNNTEKSNPLWLKTVDSLLTPSDDFNEMGATKGIEGVGPANKGVFENQNYYQFDNVTNFDNRGGTICYIVTDELSGFGETAVPGTIIFTEGGKLYGYNGTEWVKLFSSQ